jgi:O-methyltransferase
MLTAIASSAECIRAFFASRNGSRADKVQLLLRLRRNLKQVQTHSAFREQLVMLTALLNVRQEVPGVVVECGAYKGGTTVNLSLACRIARRTLYVFDSFAGFPEIREDDQVHSLAVGGTAHHYKRGWFASSLEALRDAVSRYGAPEVCRYIPGWFEDSLPALHEPVVFAYCDVDLRASEETCLRYLWPLLQDNCPLFTHEAPHREIASLFYDPTFWNGSHPPGLVGAGLGLGLYPCDGGFLGSNIGFTIKNQTLTRERMETGAR